MTTPVATPEPDTDAPGDLPDDVLAAALAAGLTYAKAGGRVGLSERTVQKRMADAAFRSRVDALKGLAVSRAIGVLTENMTGAALELARLMAEAEDEKTRLAAAKEVISLGRKARSQEELERQVADLADRVKLLTTRADKRKDR
jgi:electron transfer flavoprotein alpha subunit